MVYFSLYQAGVFTERRGTFCAFVFLPAHMIPHIRLLHKGRKARFLEFCKKEAAPVEKEKPVLAIDLGASSGRAMLVWTEAGGLRLEEVHRFANQPVSVAGRLYWDLLRLVHEIKQGMIKAQAAGGFAAVGIDTWGVDYGLLDKRGRLLQNPVHYRDTRTEGQVEKVRAKISDQALYGRTGIQQMRINTLYQLTAGLEKEPELLAAADGLLLIPDLLAYFLTGVRRTEYTNASTTGLLNPNTRDWDGELLELLGIPKHLFAPFIYPGEAYGPLSDGVCEETGCPPVPVLAVGSHDTASAVAAIPAPAGESIAYISCGTWSLFGTELNGPVLSGQSAAANFTNEAGVGGSIRYLRNIMGLWLAQQSRAHWERQGQDVSYTLLDAETEAAAPFLSYIDPDDPRYEQPGDLPARIREFCRQTGQPVPADRGAVLRCIYQSLALKYRYTLRRMERLTGERYGRIYMIGGGIKDTLLCRMTASACRVEVSAGPAEATASGNGGVQLMALGRLQDLAALRQAVAAGTEVKRYQPEEPEAWDSAYQTFLEICHLQEDA